MSSFNFKSIQSLEISSNDNPSIDVRDGRLIITAERDDECIVISAPLAGAIPKVTTTKVKVEGRPARKAHPLAGRRLPSSDLRTGETNPHAKLTEQQVLKMRELAEDETFRKDFPSQMQICVKLSKMFGIHHSTVNSILNRTSWKHI